MKELRVLVLACDGLYQRHLVHRASQAFTLCGVVVQHNPAARGTLAARLWRLRNPLRLIRHVIARIAQGRNERAVQKLVRELFDGDDMPAAPAGVPLLETQDINAAPTVAFIKDCNPEIVLVNGTNLLREPLLAIGDTLPHGIINLHTGLSPYSRGGYCNLYMLLEGKPEMVGATVHHIDRGIDSGDIILSSQIVMHPKDTFEEIEVRTFHTGIDMLLTAARQLAMQSAARVAQWEEGKLFLRRTGYVYEPWQTVLVNRLLAKGLVKDYLADKARRDAAVRTVGEVGR